MTGKVVSAYSSSSDTDLMLSSANSTISAAQPYYTPLQVGTAVTFLVALFQVS